MFNWLSKDLKLVFAAKTARAFAYGYLGVIFAIYLNKLGLTTFQVGMAITVILVTTGVFTVLVSIITDRYGRKRTLLLFASLVCVSGLLFTLSSDPFLVIIAAMIGNVSVSAGETGPFLSIEQVVIPQSAGPERRNLVFSLYNLMGYAAASAGSLLAGLPQLLNTYAPLFLIYSLVGLLQLAAYSRLSSSVEASKSPNPGTILSAASKPLIFKLASLFAFDSLAGGFVVQSIVSYWFFLRFGLPLTSLGLIFFGTQIVTAISFLVAAKIADRIGLLKTMVFTHLPSNILLMSVPLAPSLLGAVALLLARHSLSQMDVPTRQAYTVAIVSENERTAAAGITNVSRTLSQTVSPSIAGYAMQFVSLSTPFFIGGGLKIVYDLLLYGAFRKVSPK